MCVIRARIHDNNLHLNEKRHERKIKMKQKKKCTEKCAIFSMIFKIVVYRNSIQFLCWLWFGFAFFLISLTMIDEKYKRKLQPHKHTLFRLAYFSHTQFHRTNLVDRRILILLYIEFDKILDSHNGVILHFSLTRYRSVSVLGNYYIFLYRICYSSDCSFEVKKMKNCKRYTRPTNKETTFFSFFILISSFFSLLFFPHAQIRRQRYTQIHTLVAIHWLAERESEQFRL